MVYWMSAVAHHKGYCTGQHNMQKEKDSLHARMMGFSAFRNRTPWGRSPGFYERLAKSEPGSKSYAINTNRAWVFVHVGFYDRRMAGCVYMRL